MSIIISLSSIPPRFDKIGQTLESLLDQSVKADEIRLYIPKTYDRFPDYDGHLPEVPEGVTIYQPNEDYGPASKALHCIKDTTLDPDTKIMFCDDDEIYDHNWVANFVEHSEEYPDCALCGSALLLDDYNGIVRKYTPDELPRAKLFPKKLGGLYRIYLFFRILRQQGLQKALKTKLSRPLFRKSGYEDIFEGFAGVMVKPRFFTDEVFDIPEIGRFQDDIWLSANVTANGFKIRVVSKQLRPTFSEAEARNPLKHATFDGNDRFDINDKLIAYCQNKFGIWK